MRAEPQINTIESPVLERVQVLRLAARETHALHPEGTLTHNSTRRVPTHEGVRLGPTEPKPNSTAELTPWTAVVARDRDEAIADRRTLNTCAASDTQAVPAVPEETGDRRHLRRLLSRHFEPTTKPSRYRASSHHERPVCGHWGHGVEDKKAAVRHASRLGRAARI